MIEKLLQFRNLLQKKSQRQQMLKQKMVTFYILAILMWMREVESGYAATSMLDPYKYQKYGWVTIASSYNGNTAKSTTVTFAQAYNNSGLYSPRCYLAIRSFQTDTPLNKYGGLWQLSGNSYTNSSFIINTYTSTYTVYYSLSVSYFCTYGGWVNWFFRQNYNILNTPEIIAGLKSNAAYTGVNQMNISKEAATALCDLSNITTPVQQWKAIFFLTGYAGNGTSTSNVKRSYTFCSTTTLCIKFVKPQNLSITAYAVGIMIINNGTKGTIGYVQWTGQISSTPTTSGIYYFKPPYYIAYYFFGFSDFDTDDFSTVLDCQIEYSIVGDMYNLTLAKQNPFSLKKTSKVTLSYFFMMNSFCLSSPYLMYDVMKDDCNNGCPDYTISIPQYYRCMPCYPGCKTCSAMYLYDYSLDKSYSNCLSCNSADGRVLIGTRCDCANNTMFEDGHTNQCRSCGSVVPGTLTCTFALNTTLGRAYYQTLFASSNWTTTVYPLFTSLTCSAGYLLKNKLCQTCYNAIPYCTNCASNVTCLACDSTKNATLFTNAQCYLCNLTNCIMCDQDNFCYQCATGYVVNSTTGTCYLQPCNVSCKCDGYLLPKVNGTCTTQCGDSLKAGTETCDDGNLIDRDGCSSTCTVEGCNVTCTCSGYILPVVYGLCSSICGDGFKVLTQQCDDGNTLNHDGCSSLCKTQTCSQNCSCQGWVFPVVNDACSTLCGDGMKAGPQQCDDHNTVSGDGCSSLCIKQDCSLICTCEGYALPIVNGTCSTVCGDGILLLDEQCDDGNVIDYDGCSSQCVKEYCNKTCGCEGWVLPRVSGWCSTLCGDGIKAGLEQCDDGNVVSLDGCSSICQVEPCNVSCLCDGYMIPRVAGKCTTVCGDGFKAGDEECDDNNTISRDGCSSTCITQKCNQTCNCAGYLMPLINGQCSSLCGDGFKVLTEQCDDGNTANYDGCSSVCTTQGCNITCSCSGYALPRISGKCSGICGDNILVQSEQCQDGNLIDFDGCSSTCRKQGCQKTCNCSGYYFPRLNGTCKTVCGDGFEAGDQNCDDGNMIPGDGCNELCKTEYKRVNGFFIYSQDKTFYPALVLFLIGFRVVGMEMLWVFQTFQLLLEAQDQQRMRFSGNIHGYSDSAGFPFKFQSINGSIQQIKLFDKFNYMYLAIIGMFLLCAILQTLGQCLKGNSNEVANQSQISNLKGTQSTGLRSNKPQYIKQYKFEQQSDEGDFTVHYQKRTHPQTFDLLSQTRAISIQLNQPSQYKQRPHWMSRLSRVILRQLFFNLLMNVQSILVSQVIEIAVNNGIDGVLNFHTLIVIGSVEVFVVGMMAFCAVNKEYFGENQGKFKQGKCITYWIVTLFERVLIGVVIGIKVQNYLIVIAGVKLVVVLYYYIDRVYYQKLQNGRKIAVQVLHFLLITIYAVDCTYLAVRDARKALPSNMLQSIYTSILSLVVVITVVFLLRQFMSRCQADTRDSSQQNLLTENSENMAQRIFYSRKEMGESGGVMVNKGNRDNSNEINNRSIVEELNQKKGGKVLGYGHQGDNYEAYYNKGKISSKPKTVKYNDIRQQHQLREDSDYVNSDIKRSQIRSKRSQLQLKRTQGVFDQYEREDQGKSRRGQESIRRYRGAGQQQQQSQYQQQQYQAQQRYNRTGRRLGRQKGRGYVQQGHKQNSYQQHQQSYQSKPEYIKQTQSSRQPPPYNANIRHTYQQQPQPLSTKTKIKKFRSMHDSRMRHNTRQDQQYDDSVNYDAVSIRFR